MEVYNVHDGHMPGTLQSLQASRMSPELSTLIYGLVDAGYTLQIIEGILAGNREAPGRDDPLLFAEAYRARYQSIYRRLITARGRPAMLDMDGYVSVQLWQDKIRQAGGHTRFADTTSYRNGTQDRPSFVTQWQRGMMQAGVGASIACLDSTHDTCFSFNNSEEKVYLYTLFGKHHRSGRCLPLAFLLTSEENHHPVEDWLKWLRETVGYHPRTIVIDCSDTEALALEVGLPGTRIIYCQYHFHAAITRWSNKNIQGRFAATITREARSEYNVRLRASFVAGIHHIENAATVELAELYFDQLEARRQPLCEGAVSYIRRWRTRKDRWLTVMLPAGMHGMRTNIPLESFHDALRKSTSGTHAKCASTDYYTSLQPRYCPISAARCSTRWQAGFHP